MFMSLLELQLESTTNLLRGPSYSNRMPYNRSLTLMSDRCGDPSYFNRMPYNRSLALTNDRCGDGFCITCKAIILGKAYVSTTPILGGLMYDVDPSLTLPISHTRNIMNGSSHMNLSDRSMKVGTDSLSVQDSQIPTSVSKFRQISYHIFVRANNPEIVSSGDIMSI